jgi:hypothetical protein
VPPDVAQQWGDLGATIVPPTGFLQHIDLKAEVINHSGGKVDDATARKWAEALEREFRWDSWAVLNQQDMLLNQLGAADGFTQNAVFKEDYGYVHHAREAKGVLSGSDASRPRMVLVPVSADVGRSLTGFGYPSPIPEWAFVATVRGPATVVLTPQTGTPERLVDVPASFTEAVFIAGEFRTYESTLGEIWSLHTYLSCPGNDFVRAACAL